MKSHLMQTGLLAATVVMALSLGGCANMNRSEVQTEILASNVDSAQVAAINSVANSRGVKVIWLQYPTKSVASANP